MDGVSEFLVLLFVALELVLLVGSYGVAGPEGFAGPTLDVGAGSGVVPAGSGGGTHEMAGVVAQVGPIGFAGTVGFSVFGVGVLGGGEDEAEFGQAVGFGLSGVVDGSVGVSYRHTSGHP